MPPVLGYLIALAGVAALVFLSVRTLVRSHRNGGGCASCGSAGSCAHCGSCASGHGKNGAEADSRSCAGGPDGGNAVQISKKQMRQINRNYKAYLKKKELENRS